MPILRAHSLRDDGYSVWSADFEIGVLVPQYSTVAKNNSVWLWSMTRGIVIDSGTEDTLDAAKAAFASSWRRSLAEVGLAEGAVPFEELETRRLKVAPREGYPNQHVVMLRSLVAGAITYWSAYKREPSFDWRCGEHPDHRSGSAKTIDAAAAACDDAWRRWMVLAGLRFAD